ncbi:thioredoxin family protein [Desulfatibacillum aliphaticivorans]|uniref:Thioredoxin domain-containing protein n=1 Tax=Desulfatibacillum aliphaticivorans TaxID=218208 RepID=B8FIT9_DESAL|nr:thioredoxin family protein [Desulfatibacillum aliphaticivorans]ACL04330.1 hypothetical protein Dalk_2637 [Desulfatibacillum aliphaticivorans]
MNNSFDKTRSSNQSGQGPITIHNPDELKAVILDESRPLLMACMLKNEIYHEQMALVEQAVKQFEDALGVFVISKELMSCFCEKFNVKGTPTFLFFNNGKEMDRILGCMSRESLMEFITRNLETINRIT